MGQMRGGSNLSSYDGSGGRSPYPAMVVEWFIKGWKSKGRSEKASMEVLRVFIIRHTPDRSLYGQIS